MTKIGVVSMMVVVLLLAGCGASTTEETSAPAEPTEQAAEIAEEIVDATTEPTDEPAEEQPVPVSTPDQLAGMWFSGGNNALYHTFDVDGTFRAAFERENLPDQPDVQGKYWFEDGVFMIEDLAYSDILASESCAGIVGSYSAELRKGNRLYFTTIEDACEVRARSLSTVLGLGFID